MGGGRVHDQAHGKGCDLPAQGMVAVNGDLDPSRLRVGQLVTIPGATGQPVASADCLIFPVSSGDTLWGIARRFDVTVEALVAANPGVDPMAKFYLKWHRKDDAYEYAERALALDPDLAEAQEIRDKIG